MTEPRWLSQLAVLAIHQELLREFGGTPGLRDAGMLQSALSRPVNKWLYEQAGISSLAAAYAFAIARDHPFVDGNKRTAFVAMVVFLRRNGHALTASEIDSFEAMMKLASGEWDESQLAVWVETNSSQAERRSAGFSPP